MVDFVRSQIGMPYVWGGQGEPYSEAILKRKESNEANRQRIRSFVSKSKIKPSDMLIYDCSGLITVYLLKKGLVQKDMTADGLYNICKKKSVSNLKSGDLLFRLNSRGKAYHVGVYTESDTVIHAKGRDYGVVEEKYNRSEWDKAGGIIMDKLTRGSHITALQKFLKEMGYNPGVIDGIYGTKTRKALYRFIGAFISNEA